MTTDCQSCHPDFITLKRGLQRFQSERLVQTYADLTADAQYTAIGDFFFSRLYGPGGFSFSDTKIESLRQAVDGKIYRPVTLAMDKVLDLRELSDHLDNRMAEEMRACHLGPDLTPDQYQTIYRRLDNYDQRIYQIDLAVDATRTIHQLSRKWMVAVALKTVHLATHALNLGDIMDIINEGYAAFRQVRRIDPFLEALSRREKAWHRHLWGKNAP